MSKPVRIEPSLRPECVWLVYRNGERKEMIDPEIATRDKIAMRKLYQEKSNPTAPTLDKLK